MATHFNGLIPSVVVTNYAELARLGNVTRARVTQIMNLLLLAPEIQEAILFQQSLPPDLERGETRLRAITTINEWEWQRRAAKSIGFRFVATGHRGLMS